VSRNITSRRNFMLAVAAISGLAAGGVPLAGAASEPLPRLRVEQARSDLLEFGYHAAGPEEGRPVILLHDLGYDIHSYTEVARLLAAEGYRAIVPYLRGHGTTRFNHASTLRSGQQAAVGSDVIALMDVLHIPEAVIAGFGWGARAACVAAVLKPTRCVGVVAVNGYAAGNLTSPLSRQAQAALAHQYYYFQTERGRARLEANRGDAARILWADNSPGWPFDDALLKRAVAAFDNPDYVDVVIHSWRHRLGRVAGDARYEAVERKLAERPLIAVPSIVLAGDASGVVPDRDTADRFSGPYSHHPVPGAGHHLPQEAPEAFADAVIELVRNGKWRT